MEEVVLEGAMKVMKDCDKQRKAGWWEPRQWFSKALYPC